MDACPASSALRASQEAAPVGEATASGLDVTTRLRAACPSPGAGVCDPEDLGAFIDRSGLFEKVGVVRCRACGLAVSTPPVADVAELYADRGSQDFQPRMSGIERAIKTFAFTRAARAMMAALNKDGDDAPARIVDFGCGAGLFTRCLGDVAESWGGEVVGLDFHDAPPSELSDRPYAAFDAAPLGSADLVLAMHVVEHDDRPRDLVARLAALARPGGRVVIEVPNVDCIWNSVFGKYWDAWYLPYHRFHHSARSIAAVIEAAGLRVERIEGAVVPTMGRTLADMAGARNSLPFILMGAALHPVQLAGEKLFRQPSALRVIARRPT